MKLSKRQITTLSIFAVIGIALFFLVKSNSDKQKEAATYLYGYSAEVLYNEGAYSKLKDYADDIFVEMYCNTNNIVLQYAFTENGLDFQKTKLDAALFTSNNATNALHFLYVIPKVSIDDDGRWKTDGETYGMLTMRNIARSSAGNYSVGSFEMSSNSTVPEEFKKAFEANASGLISDATQRNMLAYGFLYNVDSEFAQELADKEKARIMSYLLTLQQENAGDYSMRTTKDGSVSEGASAHIDQFMSTPPIGNGKSTSISDNSVSGNSTGSEE